VGIFLISFATTLPELVFGLEAILLKHKSMSIGDQTGSVMVKNCLVLGVMAIIHPIQISIAPFIVAGIFMFLSGLFVTMFIVSGKKLEVREGIYLILIYIIFAVLQFFI
jgi:cation:H+ antiporter